MTRKKIIIVMRENYKLRIKDKIIWIDDKKFKLLKFINRYNSIRRASEKSKTPYRTALAYIKKIERILGDKIVSTKRGGAGGGGSSYLTKTGRLIIKEYLKMHVLTKKQPTFNEVKGTIKKIDSQNKVIEIDVGGNPIKAPLRGKFRIRENILLLIHPNDIVLMNKKEKTSARNLIKSTIKGIRIEGNIVKVRLKMGEIEVKSHITREAMKDMELKVGEKIFAGFKAVAIDIIKT